MLNKYKQFSVLVLSSLLLACGGGGSADSSSSSTTVQNNGTQTPPQPPSFSNNVLHGSEGNLKRYLGSWNTNCAVKLTGELHDITSNLLVSAIVNQQFVSAKLTEIDYGKFKGDCSGKPLLPIPATTTFSFKISAQVAVTGSDFTGNIDQAIIEETGKPSETIYFAFDSTFETLRISKTTNISKSNVIYKKFIVK